MLPAVEFAELSDPGRDPEKQINEDASAYRETPFGHLAVVCDGMGGHAGGREASQTAIQAVFEVFESSDPSLDRRVVLKNAIEEANRRVYGLFTGNPAFGRPGSTIVAILLSAEGTEVAHVGDSRVYLVHQSQVFQITKDHSMVQELVDRGLLTPAKAAVHPHANQITRALGMAPDAEVELRPQPVSHVAGDIFILCSDGLSDLIEPSDILNIVGNATAQQAVGQFVDLANARGGHDNITVQILRARESAVARPTQVAPTVIQTQVETAPDFPEERNTERRLVPVVPGSNGGGASTQPVPQIAPMAQIPLVPQIPPAARVPDIEPKPRARKPAITSSSSKFRATTFFAIVLTTLGIIAAAIALYMAISERSGKRRRPHHDAGVELPPASATVSPAPLIVEIPDSGAD